jgi:hypothetical protein
MANAGHRQEYGRKKTFVPLDQWIKLLLGQKDKLIAERRKEPMNSNNGKPRTPYQPQQANAHENDEVVDIDDIIDYTMLNHDGTTYDDNKGNTTDGDGLLVYMAGCSSLAGDISKVMATKTKILNTIKSGTGTSLKVNASKSTPITIQVDDNTYYLYKGGQSKLMVISTLHIQPTSAIRSANMMLLALHTRLLIAVLTVASAEMTCW